VLGGSSPAGFGVRRVGRMLVALTDSGAQAAQVLSNITGTPDAQAGGRRGAGTRCRGVVAGRRAARRGQLPRRLSV